MGRLDATAHASGLDGNACMQCRRVPNHIATRNGRYSPPSAVLSRVAFQIPRPGDVPVEPGSGKEATWTCLAQ
jgi:hypothetical protein